MSKTCVHCFKSNAKPADPFCPDCGTYFSSRDRTSGERAPLLASHGDKPDAPPPSYSEKMPVVTVRPAQYTAVMGDLGDKPDTERTVHATQPVKSGYGKPAEDQDYGGQQALDECGACCGCCIATAIGAAQAAHEAEMDRRAREHCCCHNNSGGLWGSSRSGPCHHCGRHRYGYCE